MEEITVPGMEGKVLGEILQLGNARAIFILLLDNPLRRLEAEILDLPLLQRDEFLDVLEVHPQRVEGFRRLLVHLLQDLEIESVQVLLVFVGLVALLVAVVHRLVFRVFDGQLDTVTGERHRSLGFLLVMTEGIL